MKIGRVRVVIMLGILAALVGGAVICWDPRPHSLTAAEIAQRDASMPAYQHIFVIVEENRSYDHLMAHRELTPVLHQLAAEYGAATRFYGEVHPSAGDYVAMVGGDTFGIHDDDAWYCRPRMVAEDCPHSGEADYVDHDVAARNLTDQLAEKGLTWKAYIQDVPPDPLVPNWPAPGHSSAGLPNALYASKHNGFLYFTSVNRKPHRELVQHVVGFNQLALDLASDKMPNYAHIIPNQCNEMHGLTGANVSPYCDFSNPAALIRRGDAEIGMLVNKIIHSKMWSERGNAAIVITFDESDKGPRASGEQGCCGFNPNSAANPGGGHIVTLVITNHGPRHFADPTQYNHYSLLRTTEAAFGIKEHLRQAASTTQGVVTMTPLFAVSTFRPERSRN